MKEVFEFGRITEEDINNAAIKIERTPEFLRSARQLSDYIKTLPMDKPTNDRLVALMVEQVQQAEKGSFAQGFRMGMKYAGWETSHAEEVPLSGGILS